LITTWTHAGQYSIAKPDHVKLTTVKPVRRNIVPYNRCVGSPNEFTGSGFLLFHIDTRKTGMMLKKFNESASLADER
jgi:hypothetical protein